MSGHETLKRAEVDYSHVKLINEAAYYETTGEYDFSQDVSDSDTVQHAPFYVTVTTSIYMGHVKVAVTTGAEPDFLASREWLATTVVRGVTLGSPLICTTAVAQEWPTEFPEVQLPTGLWDVTVRQFFHESERGDQVEDSDETIWFHLSPHTGA